MQIEGCLVSRRPFGSVVNPSRFEKKKRYSDMGKCKAVSPGLQTHFSIEPLQQGGLSRSYFWRQHNETNAKVSYREICDEYCATVESKGWPRPNIVGAD